MLNHIGKAIPKIQGGGSNNSLRISPRVILLAFWDGIELVLMNIDQ